MKYRVVVGGESYDCQLFVGFEGKPEGDATPADLIAALKANAAACAEVLAGMGPTHFAARDAEWWHDRFVAEKARAEQAEHSLAASERALAALRYQAQAGGCELSTVGENFYHCRADALCGLCRLRHRAEQAERSLATLRELIHTASGLDDHRYSAEQMVKEMAERWQGASDDCEKAEQALATVTAERDAAHAALRDCATRLGNGSAVSAQASHAFHCQVPTEVGIAVDALKAKLAAAERMRDTLGRRIDEVQAALNECGAGFTGQPEATRIRDLRAQLAKTERVVEAASDMLTGNCACDKYGVADTCSCAYEREERLRVALRALDSPVVAGTDSGGSGAATPEGGHAAPTGGPMPPPEPAGGSCRCGAGCKPAPRYDGDDDSPVGVAATATSGPWDPRYLAPPRVDPADLTEEPLTREDVAAMIREERERVIAACEVTVPFCGDPNLVTQPFAVLAEALRKAGKP